MRAKALEAALAAVALGPMIQLLPQIPDLLPQQTRRAITTTGLELHNRRSDFDHSGIEIDRATGGKLKRFAGARNHSASHQMSGIAKHFFWPPSALVNKEIEFRFQANHGARRRRARRARKA